MPTAAVRAITGLAVGALTGTAIGFATNWQAGLLVGWMAGAVVFLLWTWFIILPMDSGSTARHAVSEDPGRAWTDLLVVLSALASLGAVCMLLLTDGSKNIQAAFSVGSVVLAWGAVHTIFTTRYARLYYTAPVGGIDFNESAAPTYSDFAYLAFTIGMTFQVSDTDLTSKTMRATALRQSLLSYLLGTVVIATMVNLIAGLGR
ncbi:hypothetical protein BAY61_05675 [Prauserella marina]|nr:DUF1345 domain-containing protein [Prauserella marina]ASR34562.1 hypothetical protein BAY61_05675 [Prauserella marina]